MKQIALMLLLAAPAYAEPVYGVKQVQERVIELPQDQGVHYLTIFGRNGDARFEQVKNWFRSHTGLAEVTSQTKYNVIGAESVMFAERYAGNVGETPCVRLQTADGKVVFQASGDNIPMSPEALYAAMHTACLRRPNIHYHYQPTPAPAPVPTPLPKPPTPDTRPINDLPPWWLMALLAAVGAGAGLLQTYRQTHRATQ